MPIFALCTIPIVNAHFCGNQIGRLIIKKYRLESKLEVVNIIYKNIYKKKLITNERMFIRKLYNRYNRNDKIFIRKLTIKNTFTLQ